MLMAHGIYGSGRNWRSVARRFVRERPGWGAVLVDLRLHGDSTGFEPPHTVEACAEDLVRLVDVEGWDVGAVLGHSFGGKVALLYAEAAERAPDQVWVIDSSPDAREPGGTPWEMLGALREHPGPFADRAAGVRAIESEGYPNPVAQWMATNLVEGEGGLVWRLDPDAMEALLRSFFATDAWSAVEEPPVGVHVHVVKARESGLLGPEETRRVERATRATLHRVDGGHWLNADNPDALHALLTAYLD